MGESQSLESQIQRESLESKDRDSQANQESQIQRKSKHTLDSEIPSNFETQRESTIPQNNTQSLNSQTIKQSPESKNTNSQNNQESCDSQSLDVATNSQSPFYVSKRFYLIIGILFNLCLLGFFKYTDFFLENFNLFSQILHLDFSIPLPHILLPLALSFVTFQQIAFLVDCYKHTQYVDSQCDSKSTSNTADSQTNTDSHHVESNRDSHNTESKISFSQKDNTESKEIESHFFNNSQNLDSQYNRDSQDNTDSTIATDSQQKTDSVNARDSKQGFAHSYNSCEAPNSRPCRGVKNALRKCRSAFLAFLTRQGSARLSPRLPKKKSGALSFSGLGRAGRG